MFQQLTALFFQVLYGYTFTALHELLCSVLAGDLSPDGIQTMFKVSKIPHTLSYVSLKFIKPSFLSALFPSQHIESWLSSKQDHERERAVRTAAEMLQFYLDSLSVKVWHTIIPIESLGFLHFYYYITLCYY